MPSSTELPVLLERVRSGDRDALDHVVRAYYPAVERIVRASLRRELRPNRPWLTALFSTGDVVQNVFLSVLSSTSQFQGEHEGALIRYLSTVTKNRIVDSIRFHEAAQRDRRTESVIDDAAGVDTSVDPVALSIVREQNRRLALAMKRLSDQERYLVRGRLESGASFQQLADELGYRNLDEARRAFLRARARLAVWLQSKGEEADA